jgi:putative MFS transporter
MDYKIKLLMENTQNSNNEDNHNRSYNTVPKKKLPLIDEFINTAGYSFIHYQIMLLTCFILFIDGLHMTLLQSIFVPFQNLHELSNFQMSAIASTMFLSVAAGSLLSGKTNLVGVRKKAIVNFTFLIFICNLLLGVFLNIYVFVFLRLVIGISIGILMPLINNLLCEFLPIQNRSFFMVSTGVSFSIGAIFLNCLMLIITPNFEKDKLWLIFIISSFPIGVFGFIIMKYLKESPRWLIINNHLNEGFKLLEEMCKIQITEEQRQVIISEIHQGSNKNVKRELKYAFEPKYYRITLILMFIWIINSFLVYGGTSVLSLTLKELEKMKGENLSENKKTPINIIKNQMMIYIIGLPGSIVSGFMTELKIFGRKMTIFWGFLLVTLFCFIGLFNLDKFSIFFGLSGFFISLCFSASNSYSCEVYPTKIRDIAIGFLYFCTRCAGFLAQFLAMLLFQINYLGQYYATVVIGIVSCVITLMLPYDTLGRPLDVDEDEPCENNIKRNKHQKLGEEI